MKNILCALVAAAFLGAVPAASPALAGENTTVQAVSGSASYYADKFHGRRTANGETYNKNSLTAAHRTLPFGTKVRITNSRNGKSVVVRINDRGPFAGKRIIDLSRAAASSIGMIRSGVVSVKMEVMG